MGKRGYVSKVTVRRFLFIRIRGAPLEVREGWEDIFNVKTISLMKSHRNVDSGTDTPHDSSETLVPRTLHMGLHWRKERELVCLC